MATTGAEMQVHPGSKAVPSPAPAGELSPPQCTSPIQTNPSLDLPPSTAASTMHNTY